MKVVALVIVSVLYYIAAPVIYCPGEQWGNGDALYFAVVVVTTVGYGDFLPTTAGMKVATIVFVHVGLTIVVLSFTIVQDTFTSAAMHKLHGKKHRHGIFDKKAENNLKLRRAVSLAVAYAFVLGVGCISFGLMFKNHEESESEHPYLDGLYLTVITLSTVGFGDFAPMDDGTKVIGVFLMLIGIPTFGVALSAVADAFYTPPEPKLKLKKVRGSLTGDKWKALHSFVHDLRKEGVGNYRNQGHGQISRFEFLAFILCQNGVVEVRNIRNVMKNFDHLDKNNEGFITENDIGGTLPAHDEKENNVKRNDLLNAAIIEMKGQIERTSLYNIVFHHSRKSDMQSEDGSASRGSAGDQTSMNTSPETGSAEL
jgi:hypothetical protein